MSRQINVNDAESLSDEDRRYLADRGRTVEQEQARQDRERYIGRRLDEGLAVFGAVPDEALRAGVTQMRAGEGVAG